MSDTLKCGHDARYLFNDPDFSGPFVGTPPQICALCSYFNLRQLVGQMKHSKGVDDEVFNDLMEQNKKLISKIERLEALK